MPRPLLLAIGILLLLITGASAQSFDCRKAATAYEKALCADPELGQLDESLAQAWATALGGLGKPAAETMRVGQRQWLDYIQRDCSATGELPAAYSEDDYNCLRSDLYNRVRELEQSRMLGGWRFYMQQSFSVAPTTGTEDWSKPATRDYSFPLIDGDAPLAKAFNRFGRAAARAMEANTAEVGGEDPSEVDLSAGLSVKSVSVRRISMELHVSWYGHGAAHPNYTVNYVHYLAREDRALRPGDIFVGKDWQQHLSDLVLAALEEQLGDDLWDAARSDIPDWVTDTSRWDFSDQGLIVQFQPYEVTAYALGAPTVTIPWEKLGDDLAADARSITS